MSTTQVVADAKGGSGKPENINRYQYKAIYSDVENRRYYSLWEFDREKDTQQFLETGRELEKMEQRELRKKIAKEYLQFLFFLILGLITAPIVQAISSLGIRDTWGSIIRFEFMYLTYKGPFPTYLLILVPYSIYLLIRSVLWAKRQLKSVKPTS